MGQWLGEIRVGTVEKLDAGGSALQCSSGCVYDCCQCSIVVRVVVDRNLGDSYAAV